MTIKTSALAGKQLLPREIAAAAHDLTPWRNYELTKAVATALGESAGYLGAYHDNLGADGVTVVSRDCGLYQVNIPASQIGTPVEDSLRTESLDSAAYEPVLEHNVKRALDLYDNPWTRDGVKDIRRWQPWVAYTSGWATFPYAWVWHQQDGVPVGPWVATGRYIHRAIAGQMNYHVVIAKDWTPTKALAYARYYAEHFGVKEATYSVVNGIVAVKYAPKPATMPPDGIGPRPVENSGV